MKCEYCQNEVEPGARTCSACGAQAPQVIPQQQMYQQVMPQQIYCQQCNATMTDNMNFCPVCHAKRETFSYNSRGNIAESHNMVRPMTVWQKLWQPRMARSDYWIAVFGVGLLVGILSDIIGSVIGGDNFWVSLSVSLTISFSYSIFTIIWDVKRLHDAGKSAFNILWILLPFIGAIVLLILLCLPGDKERNKYGEVPKRICSSN